MLPTIPSFTGVLPKAVQRLGIPLTLLFLLYVTNLINQFHTYETSTSPRIPTNIHVRDEGKENQEAIGGDDILGSDEA